MARSTRLVILIKNGQTDMARSTRLVILIKNHTLWGRKRFLLPVTYFPYPDGQTDGHKEMARSTRLVILIKNIYMYILYGVGNVFFTALQTSD